MNTIRRLCWVLLLLGTFQAVALAQSQEQKLQTTILEKDSLFWLAYNTCDTVGFSSFFANDVEFYHDKGGLTKGAAALTASFKKNLCGDGFRLKREAIPGTVKVYPLANANVVYGAVISGEHVFYIVENGKARLDGQARFTHTWILKDNQWKMFRVLSYDHGPAKYINKRKSIRLSAEALQQFEGKYEGPSTKDMVVKQEGGALALLTKGKKYLVYPYAENSFFSQERDLTFEFVKKGQKVAQMLVRENGDLAEELKIVK